MTVIFIVDRGVSHELVRHRLCAISQESTRYCNYSGSVTFVIPPWIKLPEGKFLHDDIEKLLSTPDKLWAIGMIDAEWRYKKLLNQGWSPQQARSVLPNSLKTELAVTANFREWRHIIKLRTSKAAHPQMREIMLPFLEECKALLPVIFDNIGV
jgi:thymidylate synthase (FAD)